MRIGVLALQGDFDAHRKRLEELGAEVVLIKKPEQLNPKQAGLGAIDIGIRRNAYGRQIDSSIREGRFVDEKFGDSPIEMVFIRAPKIERVGPGVDVLATEGDDPVVVRQGNAMAATFHPELSDDTRVHRAFLDIIRNGN